MEFLNCSEIRVYSPHPNTKSNPLIWGLAVLMTRFFSATLVKAGKGKVLHIRCGETTVSLT